MGSAKPGDALFSGEALQRMVDAEMAALPPQARRAFVAYARTDGTFRVVYIEKLGEHWTLNAAMTRDLERGIRGEIKVNAWWS